MRTRSSRPRISATVRIAMLAAATLGIAAGCASNGDPTDAVIVTTDTSSQGEDEPSSGPSTSAPLSPAPSSSGPSPSAPSSSGSPAPGSANAGSDADTVDSTEESTTVQPDEPAETDEQAQEQASIDLAAASIERDTVDNFDAPIGLAARTDDDALYVIQQGGQLVQVSPDGDQQTVLDISNATKGEGERGLLGIAFHPEQPLAYAYFTDLDGATTIAEFGVDDDGTFDPASERQVWRLEQPYSNHNGGDINFGPDGMLYAGVGDGGSGGDPERRADDPATAFGSLIRIDPTASGDGDFTIPTDNPFGNEVWSYGLRNPWKFNFDATTGDLWIADVGQNEFEEINRVSPSPDGSPAGRGANFGWSAFEATTRFNDDVAETDDMVSPVLYYDHGGGRCSVSGGAMLAQWYIYGDFCTGELWGFDGEQNIALGDGYGNIAAVRNGPGDTIYVIDRNGPVYHLTVG